MLKKRLVKNDKSTYKTKMKHENIIIKANENVNSLYLILKQHNKMINQNYILFSNQNVKENFFF